MKVLLVVTGFPSARNPQRGIFNLRSARALASVGTVTVVHLRGWHPRLPILAVEEDGNLTIRRLSIPQIYLRPQFSDHSLKWNLRMMAHLGWLGVRQFVFSHDVIHSVGAASAAIVASDWSRRSGLGHVVQVTGDDLNDILLRFGGSSWIEWQHRVDAVACNSDALRQALTELYPFLENVHTVLRGVDLREFSPAWKCFDSPARAFTVQFLFLGGFPRDPKFGRNPKGGETLLAAWSLGEKKGLGTLARLILAGPNSDSREVQEWRAGLKNPESVQIAGLIPPNETPNWLRGCDAVLLPSMTEGTPNVAMEAAGCGKPVIARSVGGIPEIVKHNRTGLLFESTEPNDLADILINAAARRDQLKIMGEEARSYAEANFSNDMYALAMRHIYDGVLARRRTIQCHSTMNG